MSKKSDHLFLTCLIEIGVQWKRQELLLGKLMTKVNELASKLDLINSQMAKAIGEVQAQVAALQEAIASANMELPADAESALNNLVIAVQAFDDLHADADPLPTDPVAEEPVA